MSDIDSNSMVFGLTCKACGSPIEIPQDLMAVYIDCPNCGADNVLAPELIQARQRQHDYWMAAAERTRQVEQQRLMQQRVLAARRAASRRNTIILWTVLGIFLVLPIAVVGMLVAAGIAFGRKASHQFEIAQDPGKNGLRAIVGEMASKRADGCEQVMVAPQIQFAGAGNFHLSLRADGPCVHLMGATSVTAANLSLQMQGSWSQQALRLPDPAPSFDFRFCPSATDSYDFVVNSSVAGPFTIAAVTCPRTPAEGLVRSKAGDPVTTELAAVAAWSQQLRNAGCREVAGEPAVLQGRQIIDVESTKGGPCFNLLVASHFADALLSVRLTSPSGKPIIAPAPATRVQVEYCPSETGRYQVEVSPSTRDHFAWASLDCPRNRRSGSPNPAQQSPQK